MSLVLLIWLVVVVRSSAVHAEQALLLTCVISLGSPCIWALDMCLPFANSFSQNR